MILAALVHVAVPKPSVSAHAQLIASRVAGARLEAIASGSHVSFAERICQGTSLIVAAQGAATGVAVSFPPRGLQFTPDGLPRTCDGGGVGNTTILLEYRGRQAAVIVSALGRVRWEMR